MRLAAFPFLAAPLALPACDTELGTEVARASARDAVSEMVETNLPGVPVTPVTDCIIDNASGSEIVSIATDALDREPSKNTIRLVLEIAQRPGSVACYAEEAGLLTSAWIVTRIGEAA